MISLVFSLTPPVTLAITPQSPPTILFGDTGWQGATGPAGDGEGGGGAVSPFGLTLIDDADAPAARATLGLGTAAVQPATAFAAAVHGHVIGDVAGLQGALDLKAPLASPALTGTPSAPTPALVTNSTQLATTAFVQALVANLINAAPGSLDQLNELAAAIGNDPNFAATLATSLAGKQPIDATLTALAGLAGGADKLAYFTGTDVLAQADLTAFGRTLIGLANYAALRVGLNVADGATAYTDENARDALGAALQGTAGRVSVAPNDAGDTIVVDLADAARTMGIPFGWNAGGSVIPANSKFRLQIPFPCEIIGWTLLGDQAGSAVVDIWKDTYANYPPVVGDSITASAKPTITAANKATSTVLTGWTTAIAANDVLLMNLDSCVSITELSGLIIVRRTG